MARAMSISTAELPSRGKASFSAWGSSAATLPPLESRTLRSAIRCLMAIGCSRGSQATSRETCKAGGDELRNSRLAVTDTGSIRSGPTDRGPAGPRQIVRPAGNDLQRAGLAIGIDRQLGLIQHRVQRGPERRLIEVDGDFRIGDRGVGRPRQVGDRVAGLFLDLGEHFGDLQPPVQRDGRGLDALGGLGLLQFLADPPDGVGEVVVRLRLGRRQQVEHGRPEFDQAVFGLLAFVLRIGVEFVDESSGPRFSRPRRWRVRRPTGSR